ncbi:MAG: tyrosine-type recombinase/integrase [Pseudomonadota bacterium]
MFSEWCAAGNESWLPAAPAVVAAFVDDQISRYRLSTVKRRLCAIAFAHRMVDLPTPTDANIVRFAVRRAGRQKVSRPQQKRGLTHAIRATIVSACPHSLAGRRDAALVSVGYDTLCRSSELSAMRVEHVTYYADGSGSILIPRSKADAAGAGRIAHLSPDTVRLLRSWLDEAGVASGPLFRSLHMHRVADGPLATSSIRRLIKRATTRAALDPALTADLSGHSMRIGAAQDMMVAGFDALAIMQAGGWKSANVVLRYVENAATRELHERRWEKLGNSELAKR